MIPLFLGITIVNLLCLGLSAALGYMSLRGFDVKPWHILAGALATIVCCAVHCIVFTYFIATAKWAQHAVAVKHLEPSLIHPTRSFKRQAFPAALAAMAVVFAAAVAGAARDNYNIPRLWHHGFAILALATNLLAAVAEYRAIGRNGRLIDRILLQINGSPPDTSAPRIDGAASLE
jgi:hypothetical protein